MILMDKHLNSEAKPSSRAKAGSLDLIGLLSDWAQMGAASPIRKTAAGQRELNEWRLDAYVISPKAVTFEASVKSMRSHPYQGPSRSTKT